MVPPSVPPARMPSNRFFVSDPPTRLVVVEVPVVPALLMVSRIPHVAAEDVAPVEMDVADMLEVDAPVYISTMAVTVAVGLAVIVGLAVVVWLAVVIPVRISVPGPLVSVLWVPGLVSIHPAAPRTDAIITVHLWIFGAVEETCIQSTSVSQYSQEARCLTPWSWEGGRHGCD